MLSSLSTFFTKTISNVDFLFTHWIQGNHTFCFVDLLLFAVLAWSIAHESVRIRRWDFFLFLCGSNSFMLQNFKYKNSNKILHHYTKRKNTHKSNYEVDSIAQSFCSFLCASFWPQRKFRLLRLGKSSFFHFVFFFSSTDSTIIFITFFYSDS